MILFRDLSVWQRILDLYGYHNYQGEEGIRQSGLFTVIFTFCFIRVVQIIDD